MRMRVVPGCVCAVPVRSGTAACKNPELMKLNESNGGGGGLTDNSDGLKAALHGVVPAVAAGVVVQLIVAITVPVPGSVQFVVTVEEHEAGGFGIGGPACNNTAGGRE